MRKGGYLLKSKKKKDCLVLLSGGQDSATCLAWAKEKFEKIYTMSFSYGQRHFNELICSKKLSDKAEVIDHYEIKISCLKQLGNSALLDNSKDISAGHILNSEVPASFVPGRNYLFLGIAAAKAFSLGIHDLVTGVCQTDSSGYSDCRDNSIKAIQVALSLSIGFNFIIHTPLMWKTKAETVLMMKEFGKLDWYKNTLTCYEGQNPPCGKCPACKLRQKGFEEAKTKDPLLEKV